MNKKLDEMTDHEYDGIREFDNPLPGWWLATFYGAMVFAAIYLFYYHGAGGPDSQAELAQDLDAIAQSQKLAAQKPGPTEEDLKAIFADAGRRAAGKIVFVEKCASCHGGSGEGLIGPNLTDAYWIHGNGSLTGIFTTVSDGVADKGMPPWKALLKEEELQSVVAYVRTLKGTKPANAKAAQGEEIKD